MTEIEIPSEMYQWMEEFGDPDVFAVAVVRKALMVDRRSV